MLQVKERMNRNDTSPELTVVVAVSETPVELERLICEYLEADSRTATAAQISRALGIVMTRARSAAERLVKQGLIARSNCGAQVFYNAKGHH